MKDEILTLAASLCGIEGEDAVLEALCTAACRKLDGMLADGVTVDQCREEYLLAAAWMVADWQAAGRDPEGITALTAGDMSVRREAKGGGLEARALRLMAPWLRDRSFVFRGVKG